MITDNTFSPSSLKAITKSIAFKGWHRPAWQWLTLAVTLLSFIYLLYVEMAGDDLGYSSALCGANPLIHNFIDFLKWPARHWFYVNGRFANYLMPFFGVMPHALRALLCSLAIGAMLTAMIVASNLFDRSGWISVAMISVIMLALPWWDSFQLIDVQLNYVWSTVAVVLLYIIWTEPPHSRGGRLLSCAVAFLAGCSHEAAGLPLMCGYIIYCITAHVRPDKNLRLILISFASGIALNMLCPGTLSRIGRPWTPDDTMLWLFLKSLPIVGVMLLCMGCLALSKSGRNVLGKVLHSQLSIPLWAAVVSSIVCLGGGIVGRSGWFASIYALIVIFTLIGHYLTRPLKGVTIVLSIVTIAQLAATDWWQYILGSQQKEFIEKFKSSTNGVVFMDALRDDAAPWFTLGKVRGVPDADDYYLLESYTHYYRTDHHWPLLLPVDAKQHLPLPNYRKVKLSNGDILSTTLPSHSIAFPPMNDGSITIYRFTRDGSDWIATPLPSGGFHLSPRIWDPGDRNP